MTWREPFAALRAAPLNDQTTGLGAHALAESVSLGTATIIRLKRTLHWETLLSIKSTYSENDKAINRFTCCQAEPDRDSLVDQDRRSTINLAICANLVVSSPSILTASIACSYKSRARLCAPSTPHSAV